MYRTEIEGGFSLSPHERTRRAKEIAAELGFERCGVATAGPIARGEYFVNWLAAGRAGSMGYLHRHRASRLDPSALLAGARSVIVVAQIYRQSPLAAAGDGRDRGRVAMYAWGEDYHVVLRERLDEFVARLRAAVGEPFEAKVCVDTSAVVERELAAAAGIGWIGKNTLVMHESIGSYFFLGVVLTTLELTADGPATDHCGTCTRCLDACPTQAFPAAYEMDARRCISYLTIEHRGEVDPSMRPAIGDWVFGCDVCQEVCPFNRDTPNTREPRYSPRRADVLPPLEEIASWDERAYREFTAGRATDRATLAMWKRNAGAVRDNREQGQLLTDGPNSTSRSADKTTIPPTAFPCHAGESGVRAERETEFDSSDRNQARRRFLDGSN